MATKQLNARIVLRNDTKAQWALANPILLKGEIGVEFDPNATASDRKILFKIGDGVAHWNDLPYGGGDFAEVIAELQADVEVLEEKAATLNYQKVNNVWVPVRVQTLENTVGDATHGLVKSVADLQATVGTSSSGLVKDVYDLKQTVGGSSSGLVKKVSDLETTVGDSNSGLVQTVEDLDYRFNIPQGTMLTEAISSAVLAETNRAQAVESNLSSRIDNAAGSITSLQGDVTDLDTRLDTVEDTVGTLTASVGIAGSIANQLDNVQTGLQNQIGSGFGDSYTVAAAISSLDGRVDALEGNHFEVVSTLPATGLPNVIYLVPDAKVGYKEWIYIKTSSDPETYAWEEIGDTDIDLSNYFTKSETEQYFYTKTIADGKFATTGNLSASIANEVTRANAAYLANDDVLILDCGVATSNYSAS